MVTRTLGSRFFCRALTLEEVSPVRCSTDHGTASSRASSVSARVVSAASARSGVIQRTRMGSGSISPSELHRSDSHRRSSIGPIAAACVLPLPVGEAMSPSCPSR